MKLSNATRTVKASTGHPVEAALLRGRRLPQPPSDLDQGPEVQPQLPNAHLLTIVVCLGRSAARAPFAAAIAGMGDGEKSAS